MDDPLKKIDTSYWKTGDSCWVAEREANWLHVEAMLRDCKTRRGINIIKAYFLKGKMPNWDALREWDDDLRHVDLFIFLWLHPSWDKSLLQNLRDSYISSRLILPIDLQTGFDGFLDSQIVVAASPYRSMEQIGYPYIEGRGETLFDVMFGRPIQTVYDLNTPTVSRTKLCYSPQLPSFGHLATMGTWLCLNDLLPFQQDFLYQYDRPLEWWYESVKEVDYFNLNEQNKEQIPYFQKALYRIQHFDCEREGDTCRSRFSLKMREILGKRPFFAELENMWKQVQSGEIRIENAFDL